MHQRANILSASGKFDLMPILCGGHALETYTGDFLYWVQTLEGMVHALYGISTWYCTFDNNIADKVSTSSSVEKVGDLIFSKFIFSSAHPVAVSRSRNF